MTLNPEIQNRLLMTKLEQMRIEIAKLKYQNQRLKEENVLVNQRLEQLEQGYITKMVFDKAIASIMNSIESLKSMHVEESCSNDSVDTDDLFLCDLFQQIADERESEVFEERTSQKNKLTPKTVNPELIDRRPILTTETIISPLEDLH